MSSKILHSIIRGIIRYPVASVLTTVALLITMPMAWLHFTTVPQATVVASKQTSVSPKVSPPVAKPAAPTPKPTPTIQAPAPKPVAPTRKVVTQTTRTTAAPSAVAATSTAPGKSVSSLNPTPTTSSTPPPTSTTTTPPPSSSAAYTSLNWAGYAAMTSGTTYTAVSGSWVIPTPTPNGTSNSADASWIGIGGITTKDLIQVGTENTVDPSGKVSSAVFYELLPSAPIYPTSIIVTSGDSMSATITETSSGVWTISITDITTSQTFTTSVNYTSSHSSAEWIEEDPSYSNGSLVPLDFFGSVPFSSGTTTANGTIDSITSSAASSIDLVTQAGAVRVQVSAVGGTGKSFTTTRTAN